MTRWYRAYEGTVTDAKLHEAAVVAGVSRSVAIATWHALLEACAGAKSATFDTTPRRIAVILGETPADIEALFAALSELGMIAEGQVAAWSRRQFDSDNSSERSRKHREAKRNGGATLQQRSATPPEAETEAETDRGSSESAQLGGCAGSDDLLLATLSEAVVGLHPVKTSLDTSSIQRLIDAGHDLNRHILPVVREKSRVAKAPIKVWGFFASIVQANAQAPVTGPPPDAPLSARQKLSLLARSIGQPDDHASRERSADRSPRPLLAAG